MRYKLSNSPLLITCVAISIGPPVFAGTRVQEPAQEQEAQADAQSNDPILQLNLSPEQRQRIREIARENRDGRVRINRQLREAQSALQETLDADSPSEAVVDQRIKDVANAQAAQIRMRALTELRIRSVLTPDQLRIWRDIRQQQVRRRLNNADDARPLRPLRRNLPGARNGIAPLLPRNRRLRVRP